MKRAIVLVSLVAAFGAFAFACSAGTTDTLKNTDSQPSISGGDDESTTPKTSAPATQKTTAASSVPSTTAKTDAGVSTDGGDPLAACDPAKTTTFEACATCCATQQPVVADLNTCACGTNSACGASCGTNMCTGDIPSLDCALCLVQAGCDFGNADTDTSENSGESCLTSCASKL